MSILIVTLPPLVLLGNM